MSLEAANKFLTQSISDLKDYYASSGRKASGRWAESLEQKAEESDKGYKLQIWGERYTGAIVQPGRKANKKQSVDEAKKLYPIVLQWIKDKGLGFDNNRAFAIALKWVYKGINVPNTHNQGDVISHVINEKWAQEGAKAVGGALLTELKSDYINKIKK